jgi:hypothetical protein
MDSRPPPDFGSVLARLTVALTGRDIPFMLIGGQAVLLHGEPRLTEDIDVTLGLPPADLDVVLAACQTAGFHPLPTDLARFVAETFVLPAEDRETGIRVDFIFSTTPYEAQAIRRAVRVEIGGESVPFASGEDLLLHKLFAGRPRDLEDAQGVVRRKGADLDWGYLERWAREFAAIPGREGLPGQVRRLRQEAEG